MTKGATTPILLAVTVLVVACMLVVATVVIAKLLCSQVIIGKGGKGVKAPKHPRSQFTIG